MSSPVTAAAPAGGTAARQFTEPLRELGVFALLAGNGVFMFLGFSGLFFVIERWASDFGLRCAQVFSTFVGPVSLGLPIVALLLATHVAPMIRRARLAMIVILSELGVSAVFGSLTFLGAFAHDLSSPRSTIEGTLWRIVWLGFLVLAAVLTVRLWLGLYPPPKPAPAGYPYPQPSYGRPYPGQPLYPQQAPTYAGTPQPGVGAAGLADATPSTGWPLVPPPPMPEPLVVAIAEPTVRVSPQTIEISGDLTQQMPAPGDLTQKVPPPPPEVPTQEVPQLTAAAPADADVPDDAPAVGSDDAPALGSDDAPAVASTGDADGVAPDQRVDR